MICRAMVNSRICNGEMKSGTALVTIMGNVRGDYSRGATIYPISSEMSKVKKCEDCGHSVSFVDNDFHGRGG